MTHKPDRLAPKPDDRFFKLLESLVQAQDEVLIRYKLSHAAGADGYCFCTSTTLDQFRALVDRLPDKALIIAFKNRRLPIRGIVNGAFIKRVLKNIPDNHGALVVSFEPCVYDLGLDGYLSSSQKDLRENLETCREEEVAVGEEPDIKNQDDMIVVVKGGVMGGY